MKIENKSSKTIKTITTINVQARLNPTSITSGTGKSSSLNMKKQKPISSTVKLNTGASIIDKVTSKCRGHSYKRVPQEEVYT